MADATTPIRSGQSRSTGNRRAVRNALFRSMMDRRKLRESDLRPSRTVLGPTYVWAPRPDDPAHRRALDPCETYGRGYGQSPTPDEIVYIPPEPHPWVRLWRRLVWGA